HGRGVCSVTPCRSGDRAGSLSRTAAAHDGPAPSEGDLVTEPRASAPEPFDMVDLIRAKRDGAALGTDAIDWLISRYASGFVGDEQMAAFAMAVFLNGMDRREIRDLTLAMIDSGERMDFSALDRPTADKHSTGGVGDKITLPL